MLPDPVTSPFEFVVPAFKTTSPPSLLIFALTIILLSAFNVSLPVFVLSVVIALLNVILPSSLPAPVVDTDTLPPRAPTIVATLIVDGVFVAVKFGFPVILLSAPVISIL